MKVIKIIIIIFMDHMGMPDMLDESIYLALFGKEKD